MKAKNDNPKTINALTKTLKAFIAVCFGENVADNPRSHIAENDITQGTKYTNGIIQIAFDKNGYKVPVTGRTLSEWIKNSDISDLKQ
ncbi:hypothetical protein ACWA5Z_10790 [Testudinibacter sp. P80/BLE/0925]|uniref:hypothetical protein n=1 Tax=Testudinibacter sp. TW-1 TaxID=3417757 RepID=UPI003D35E22C